ncbi:putative chromatin remodeling & transcriptional activation HMG family [Medicago truncatula]|uniref:Putative chromatin remodeling & transcriptional activation HMG family n=1 Tax=Medicago truncatula TaxID=3880 RepID=A0A396I4N0_MEDTR|nr:putative chromatin remodeling & transcriptional activation HMG family [Medicago truncatula]
MEDQNLNLPYTLSPSSTQNESETTNNAAIVTEVLGNDAGSDTGAKSKSVGSESAPVKRGRGRPRKYEVGGKPLSPVTPTPGLAIQPCGSEEKRGRGRPRGSGKLQILASIGMSFFYFSLGFFVPFCLFLALSFHFLFIFNIFYIVWLRRLVFYT